jgi:Na+-translocating ferredoxin:NAD+ oxidoreductase RNF subunit RnfB
MAFAGEVAVAVAGTWAGACGFAGCAAEAAATPNAGVAAPILDPTGFTVGERPMFLLSMPVVASAFDEAAD